MRSKARQIHRVRRAVVLILVGRVVSGRDWWTKLRIPSPEQKVNLENTLNRFIEAIAVMLVTSCVIPILVLLFFVWLVKLVLGVNITLPQIGKKRRKREKEYEITDETACFFMDGYL